MASEPVECQVLVLRVSIHCEGCKKKVRKVLLHVDGVYRCDIDARMNKVTVTASRNLDAGVLIARLRKSGKQAWPWPEEPKQPQPAESQSQETNNQAEDQPKPNEPAEKPAGAGPPESAAAEPSNANAQPAPEPEKKSADHEAAAPKPAQENKEADETGQKQPNEAARGKAKQQQPADQAQDQKPIDAKVTLEFEGRSRGGGASHGGHGYHQQHMPMTPQQQPVHIMSYNVARPMASASYYAAAPAPAAPAPMPMPMPMPRASQGSGYIDEYAPAPNYYSRPAPSAASYSYETPPYYYPSQEPSPYNYRNHQRSAAEDYYYGSAPAPQRSAFSPPRDAYGDMFNDENANSCSVM